MMQVLVLTLKKNEVLVTDGPATIRVKKHKSRFRLVITASKHTSIKRMTVGTGEYDVADEEVEREE